MGGEKQERGASRRQDVDKTPCIFLRTGLAVGDAGNNLLRPVLFMATLRLAILYAHLFCCILKANTKVLRRTDDHASIVGRVHMHTRNTLGVLGVQHEYHTPTLWVRRMQYLPNLYMPWVFTVGRALACVPEISPVSTDEQTLVVGYPCVDGAVLR